MTYQEILRKVEWKDLRHLSIKEMLIENNLTIPWFLISITLAYFGYYFFAITRSIACSLPCHHQTTGAG